MGGGTPQTQGHRGQGEKGTPVALYIYIIYTYRTGCGAESAPPAPQICGGEWEPKDKGGGEETKASLGLAPLHPPAPPGAHGTYGPSPIALPRAPSRCGMKGTPLPEQVLGGGGVCSYQLPLAPPGIKGSWMG